MRLYEYEGMELFQRENIRVPDFATAGSTEEALEAAISIGLPVILKAQVLTGGRYLAGGVRTAHSMEEVEKEDLLGTVPRGDDLFALKVKGDSMLEDHIRNGDFVMVRKTVTASPGSVVVALIDGEEATLKRYFPEGAYVRLQPANSDFKPIVIERDRVMIQGEVVGVLRLYR